ncbi:hypothetical protein L63ED372_01926 [Limnohabitans sp. 63ED37-2]|nr:hypothetical protein L63ED372_01926 [Limnohabitans sp. 63ED37-2]
MNAIGINLIELNLLFHVSILLRCQRQQIGINP